MYIKHFKYVFFFPKQFNFINRRHGLIKNLADQHKANSTPVNEKQIHNPTRLDTRWSYTNIKEISSFAKIPNAQTVICEGSTDGKREGAPTL